MPSVGRPPKFKRIAVDWPKDDVIDRILHSVDLEGAPRIIDRVAFRADLRQAILRYRVLTANGNEGTARSRRERLDRIAKLAGKLASALSDPTAEKEVRGLRRVFPEIEGTPSKQPRSAGKVDGPTLHVVWEATGVSDPCPSLDGIVTGLFRLQAQAQHLIGASEQAQQTSAKGQQLALRTQRSPFDLLVSNWLAAVYEIHTGRRAGTTYKEREDGTKEIGGPYIRFVQSCLAEMDITYQGAPYAPATIARSLTAKKSSQSRIRTRGRKSAPRSPEP